MYIRAIMGATLAAVILLPGAYAAERDAVVGQWVTDGGKSRVEISKLDGKYVGKLAWLKDRVYEEDDAEAGKIVHDRENPDKSKRNRPVLGLSILKGFVYTGKHMWKKGTIYDPENGKTYKCKMKLVSQNKLDVRGYIGISMIGRTTVWTRYIKPKEVEKEK